MANVKRFVSSKIFLPLAIAAAVFLSGGIFFAANSGSAASSTHAAAAPAQPQTRSPHTMATQSSSSTTSPSTTQTPSAGTSSSSGNATKSTTKSTTGSSGASGSTSSGGTHSSSGGTTPTPTPTPTPAPTPPPVTTPPTTTPPPAAYIVQGENGVLAALDAVRASNGLAAVPLGVSTGAGSYLPQQCAVTWTSTRTDCAWSQTAMTGVSGVSGSQAVANWMSTSSASLLLEPGIQKIYVGWAWLPPSVQYGGGYVAIIDVCAATPGNQPVCP